MKRIVLTLALLIGIAQLSVFNSQLSVGCAFAQLPYGYAPEGFEVGELTALGFGNKSGFVQGMVLFDPANDPTLARLKGQEIKGVRCYMRADYKQAKQKRSAILVSTGKVSNIVRTQYADLLEGWNNVLLDEPLVIGDEKIYLGIQAYETLGTPYPLVAYAQASVPQSCWVNLGKKTWEEYTDRGTLLISALFDEGVKDNFERCAYAQNTTHPQTVAPERDFTGGLYIHNFSSEPIQHIELAMQGEGASQPTYRDIQLDTPIPPLGGAVVTTQLRAGLTEGTSVDWTATVTKINGNTAQAGRPGTTKLYVTYDNFIRTPLIEEFTSQRCIACPQMAYFLDKAFETYGDNYVYVSHHTGFQEDAFTTQPDREILYFFGGYENEYNPAIMYNRAILEGENQVIQGIRDMSPTPYLQALALAADMPAMAEVNIEANGDNVTISGRVARDLVGTPLYLSCYLVEDGISTANYFQKGMDDDDAPADLKDVFRHNGIILHYFTTEAIGDLLSTDERGSYSITYPNVQKAGFGGTGRRIVAFIHKVNKERPADNYVLNASELSLNTTNGIEGIKDEEIRLKNPQSSILNSQFIFDLSGRPICASSVTSVLRKGVYIKDGKKVVMK